MITESQEVERTRVRAPEKVDRSKIRVWTADTQDGKFVALFQYFPPNIAEQLKNGIPLSDCGLRKRYTWLKTSYHWTKSQQRKLYPDHSVFAFILPESAFESLLQEAVPAEKKRVPLKFQIDPDRNSNGGPEYVEDAIGGDTKLATLHFAVFVGSESFDRLSDQVSRVELLDLEKDISELVNLGLQETEYPLPTKV
jgi:hypothetical protein